MNKNKKIWFRDEDTQDHIKNFSMSADSEVIHIGGITKKGKTRFFENFPHSLGEPSIEILHYMTPDKLKISRLLSSIKENGKCWHYDWALKILTKDSNSTLPRGFKKILCKKKKAKEASSKKLSNKT